MTPPSPISQEDDDSIVVEMVDTDDFSSDYSSSQTAEIGRQQEQAPLMEQPKEKAPTTSRRPTFLHKKKKDKTKRSSSNSNKTRQSMGIIMEPMVWKQKKKIRPPTNEYKLIGLCMGFCVLYIAITSFAPEPFGLLSSDCPCEGDLERCICPRPTVEALTAFQMFCLGNSRIAAYVCYPLYLVICLSMSRNVLAYLQHTPLIEFLPIPTSAHKLHVWSGKWIGICVLWHALWHLVRWGVQQNILFLIETQTGITGFIMVVLTPIIVWPMQFEFIRARVSFEIRKRFHYMSWVWLGSLCFHAPERSIFLIVGTFFLLYLIDWFVGIFVASRPAFAARFVKLESAVMIRVQKPQGFRMNGAGGYCYLCIPWISKTEWHAFSTFRDPHDDDYICFCIAVAGDWTQKLYNEIREPVDRRLWINGPYPSPFELASDSDNIISVASGIGITPALSAIKSLSESRQMHLIWMVRDPGLLEFMFDYGIAMDDDAYTIVFYTGKRELVFRRPLPYNVLIFKGRPNLDELIVSLVEATTMKKDLILDDKYQAIHHQHQGDMEGAGQSTVEHTFYKEVTRLLSIYTKEEIFYSAVRKSNLNMRAASFQGFKELVAEIFLCDFSDSDLHHLFEMFDEDNSGTITREEFDSAMRQLEEDAKQHAEKLSGGKSDEGMGKQIHVPLAQPQHHDETSKFIVDRPDRWRLLYCGGSAPVVKALKKVSADHQIPLSTESFAW